MGLSAESSGRRSGLAGKLLALPSAPARYGARAVRSVWRRFALVRWLVICLTVAVLAGALALGGLWLGMRLSTPGSYRTAIGTVSFQVQPAAHGSVDVFVPLADWGLRARPFKAPVRVHVEPRALDRQALVSAASGDRQLLTRTVADLRHDVTLQIRRTALYLVIGVLAAALIGAGGLRALRVGGRRLLIALPATTVLIAAALCGATLERISATWKPEALSHPTYYARGAELIQLLSAAQNASRAEDSYATKVQGALSGFAALLTDPSAGQVDGDRRALLVSDLHSNTLALSSLRFYAQDQPVFFVGDFANTGDSHEQRTLVPALARLGSSLIAVSGDHDSHSMMLALARHGATVLTSHGQLLADGRYGRAEITARSLRIAGFDDPMEYYGANPDSPTRIFSFAQLPDEQQALGDARQRLLTWFRSLPARPDVLLIHQNGLAQWLGADLYRAGYTRPLTILTGHDHIQHVNHDGPIVIVDAGTVGASGLYGIGTDYVGLGELHWPQQGAALSAADLIQIEPVSGVAQAQRVVPDSGCDLTGTGCTSGVDYLDPREGPNTTAIGGAVPVSPLSPKLGGRLP